MTDKKIPVVKCFPISEEQVKLWCPFCETWHVHGFTPDITTRGKSHRVAHCPDPNSPFDDTGYYLRLMTQKEIKEVAGSLEFHQSKKSSSR
jgi:hypothetical protein